MEALAGACGILRKFPALAEIPVGLSAWTDLTGVSGEVRGKITADGGRYAGRMAKTGFEPYEKEGEIMSGHRRFLSIVRKYKEGIPDFFLFRGPALQH